MQTNFSSMENSGKLESHIVMLRQCDECHRTLYERRINEWNPQEDVGILQKHERECPAHQALLQQAAAAVVR